MGDVEHLNSMTGYGRAAKLTDGREAVIELRGVNHRYLDLNFRLPRQLNYLERPLRETLAKYLERGKIEIYLSYRNHREDRSQLFLDKAMAMAYMNAVNTLSELSDLPNDLTPVKLASMQQVILLEESEDDKEAVEELVISTLQEALQPFLQMRSKEGEQLCNDMILKLKNIKAMVESIDVLAEDVEEIHSKRLHERMQEFYEADEDIKQRFSAEIALLAEKHAIDEEIVRMNSHIKQFQHTLHSEGAIGRKLDFIVQEMNREINTIGSKANDSRITNYVVDCKADIEKIREQVQNIE